MALDLYVGPLCRYYARDWKTIGERIAEEMGVGFQTVGLDDDMPSSEQVAEVIPHWQDHIYNVISETGGTPQPWEDLPGTNYNTDRPGWEGLAGLIYKYLYLSAPHLQEPEIVPDLTNLDSDPAFQEISSQPSLIPILTECQLWIPGSFRFSFGSEAINQNEIGISSLGLLNEALDRMCSLWGVNRDRIVTLETSQPNPESTLNEAAIHGLVVFCRLAADAQKRNLPAVLDF